ncbi:MAG: hypothetical protein BWY98_00045 [Tenericutes bacterium ADurb.BinA155]|jgi:hypothetical protein|nr:MAG: hypothetical protein BWY98_00045 [Tenericutes bacterium ADurb.BinA155]
MNKDKEPSIEELSQKIEDLAKENEALKKRLSSLEKHRSSISKGPQPAKTGEDSPRLYGYLSSAGFTSHLDPDLTRAELIKRIVGDYFSVYGLQKTREAFPDWIQGSFGVLKTGKEITDMGYSLEEVTTGRHRRYFSEPLDSEGGQSVYLSSEWKGGLDEDSRKEGANFYRFVARAVGKLDYQIFTGEETYTKDDFTPEEYLGPELLRLTPTKWPLSVGDHSYYVTDFIAKFGAKFKAWMKGSWPWDRPDIRLVLCFIKPDKKDQDWQNSFSSDGSIWTQEVASGKTMIDDVACRRIRLLFIKDQAHPEWTFFGVYAMKSPFSPTKNSFIRLANQVRFDQPTQTLFYTTFSREEVTLPLPNLYR